MTLIKRHLRVTWDDEDTEIEAYRDAAEDVIVQYLDRVVYETGGTSPGGDAIELPAAVRAAILLMCGELYDRRETPENNDGEAMLSPVVRRLLASYRVWRTWEEDDDS
jgi:hypothetical protein